MSLIQDALKRQQEETESSPGPLKVKAAISVPDAMPVQPDPEPVYRPLSDEQPLSEEQPSQDAQPADSETPARSGKSWKPIAGIIIFCILIVLGVVFLVGRMPRQTLFGHFNALLSRAPAVNVSVPAKQAPVVPPVAATPKPAVPPASVSASWISPAAATAPAMADEGEDVEKDVVLSVVKEQVEQVVVPAPVFWPRLKLSAVFSNLGSGQSGARLNNRLILLGDQIDGVTLLEIHPSSVVLKFGKEIRTLKMGATLN